MNESTKSKARREAEGFYDKFLVGKGIDIGCGGDPILPTADAWDMPRGDAQSLPGVEKETYDYVYSSHCLEHMRDPLRAIIRWWEVLKPGGYLAVAIPDEDLYEQGIVPSVFNPDHKVSFTISKGASWSPWSQNVVELIQALPNHKIIYIRTIDSGYDYSKLGAVPITDQTMGTAEAAIEFVVQKLPITMQVERRTSLSHLMVCPNCDRLELLFLGLNSDKNLCVLCKSCGKSGALQY